MVKKQNNLNGKTVVISRTDSIGDVILTLPMCAWIKDEFPESKIIFLGKKYTQPVLECFPFIDEIKYWDVVSSRSDQDVVEEIRSWKVNVFIHVFPDKEIAKLVRKAKVPVRIGTSHRTYHLLTCNVRPSFTRKNSDLHEAQLNFKLLSSFGVTEVPSLEKIKNWLSNFQLKSAIPESLQPMLESPRRKVILHPKSQGSAVEWPLEKYIELATELANQNYRIYFSGTEKEGLLFRDQLPRNENIIDISGKMSLAEFIAFISEVDGLVACSTGPLHIAAALGKRGVGLFTNIRPMHPGRWMPIGKYTEVITSVEGLSSPEEEINSIEVGAVLKKMAL